jgi:catechol 2,3-dioxygenase-like lactoylglutathione lyase family enzyme
VAIEYVFAGMATADIAAARDWYERLFGRPPDLVPNDTEVCWQLAGAGWVYVVEDPARAGRGLLTLLVDDLDAVVAGLVDRGIEPGPIEAEGDAVRKSVVTDPEGSTIAFAQVV